MNGPDSACRRTKVAGTSDPRPHLIFLGNRPPGPYGFSHGHLTDEGRAGPEFPARGER